MVDSIPIEILHIHIVIVDEVVPIQKGKRFVIISFFFGQEEIDAKDKEGNTTCIKNNQRYRFKTERDLYNINLSDIYPKSK